MTKVAINGFGRIGRATFKNIFKNHPDLEVVAINDLTDPVTLKHLLKYDSIYRIYEKGVKAGKDTLVVDGKTIKILAEKDPANLPWKKLEVDVVVECTGVFRKLEDAKKHLTAGAKKVIISAPAKDEEVPSFVLGVNEEEFDPQKDDVMDMGSCTTNCLAPVAKVLDDNFGILEGFMTTIHSYTNDQKILDLPHKDLRRSRAAALNIIPTTTGAAKAIGKVIPKLKGKLDGIAIRVPSPVVSIIDLVCQVQKKTTPEEINNDFKKASQTEKLKGILDVENAPLVSTDYIGNTYSAVVDAENTKVINGNLVKILAWYDNEYGYGCRLAELAEFIGKKL
jgi:glyceraldehyde 3-phosphate dehydrogenase